jgi:hypothetical protein
MEQYVKPNMELIVLPEDVITASCPTERHDGCCTAWEYSIETPDLP